MKQPLLTIVMPSLLSRRDKFYGAAVQQIEKQLTPDVEFIALVDNQYTSIGRKVDALYEMAHGKYVTAVGDDDLVADDYVYELLQAIRDHPDSDVIVFDAKIIYKYREAADVRFGIELNQNHDGRNYTYHERWPDEKMAIRADIVKRVKHQDSSLGEDAEWAAAVNGLLKQQHRIDATLYIAQYDDKNPERVRV